MSQTYDFSKAPNMPKGYPSKLQALAAAEILEPEMKATARETNYGWVVDIDDGEGSIGSIVQNGTILWWCKGTAANAPDEARAGAENSTGGTDSPDGN